MDDTINYLASHGALEGVDGMQSSNNTVTAKTGMLWIDVEGTQVRIFFSSVCFFILCSCCFYHHFAC